MWVKVFHRVNVSEENFTAAHDWVASFTAFFGCSADPPVWIRICFATETGHRLLPWAWAVCDLRDKNRGFFWLTLPRDCGVALCKLCWPIWLHFRMLRSRLQKLLREKEPTTASKMGRNQFQFTWNRIQNRARSIWASFFMSSRLRPALPSLSCFSSSE